MSLESAPRVTRRCRGAEQKIRISCEIRPRSESGLRLGTWRPVTMFDQSRLRTSMGANKALSCCAVRWISFQSHGLPCLGWRPRSRRRSPSRRERSRSWIQFSGCFARSPAAKKARRTDQPPTPQNSHCRFAVR